MSEQALASLIAIIFLISNFLTIFLVVAMYALRGFTFDEMTTTIAILIPVFVTYTTVIIKFAVKHGDQTVRADQQTRRHFFLHSQLCLFLQCLSLRSWPWSYCGRSTLVSPRSSNSKFC